MQGLGRTSVDDIRAQHSLVVKRNNLLPINAVNGPHSSLRRQRSMSIAHDYNLDGYNVDGYNAEKGLLGSSGTQVPVNGKPHVLHRIADARRRQNISVRSAARRLGKS